MSKQPQSSTAIMADIKLRNGTSPAYPANSIKSAQALWRKLIAKHHPTMGMLPEFSEIQRGQFGRMVKALGPRSDSVVSCVLKDWIAYSKYTAAQAGLKITPDAPNLTFLSKHLDKAVGFAQTELQLTAPKLHSIKKKMIIDKPSQPVTSEDGTPSDSDDDDIASVDVMKNWKPT